MNSRFQYSPVISSIANILPIYLYCSFLILFCSLSFVDAEEFPFPEEPEQQMQKTTQLFSGDIQNLSKGTQHSGYLAQQFKERIRENEDEIRFLINEKDWLQNRIYRLEDLNEVVPWNMRNSIDIKERKIRAAFRENSRLNELLRQERYQSPPVGSSNIMSSYPMSSNFTVADLEGLRQKLSQEIRDAGLDEWLKLTSDGRVCTLENVLPILFSSGSARLSNEYKVFLKRLAHLVKDYHMRIRIDGFADVDNIHTKRYPSNFELGAIRAANIVHELVKNGVKPSVFQIATTGKYRLDGKIMSNNKSLERKAEIYIQFVSPA